MKDISRLLAKLETEPDNVDIYFDLADAYDRTGNLAEAKNIMIRLLQKPLSPEDWGHARRWLGWIYYKENDFEAAMKIAEELVAANLEENQTGQAYDLMGRCLMERHWNTRQTALSESYLVEAVQSFEQAAGLIKAEGEDRAMTLLAWGTALWHQDRYDIAAEVLKSALSMIPAESRIAGMCHEQLGLIYCDGLQKYEKSIFHLEEAARVLLNDDRDYPLTWAYTTLSRAYTQLQQYDQALANAQRALYTVNRSEEDWESQLSAAHRACGDAYYYGKCDLSLAHKHYKEYLKLLNEEELTKRAQTLIKLADIEKMKGEYKRALKGFRKALALKASSIVYDKVYSVMGDCAYGLRNFKEAVEAYKSAIEYGSDETERIVHRYQYLGHSLFELKRYEEAAEAYREGLKYVDPKAPERSEMMKYLMAANELKGR